MAVQPGTYNIKLQRRADYSVLLQFKDSNDAVIDLTGYTAYAQAWNKNRTKKYADFSIAYTNRINGQNRSMSFQRHKRSLPLLKDFR